MSINFNKLFRNLDIAAEDAADIFSTIQLFIHIAQDSQKTGPEKLAAVKAAAYSYVAAAYPDHVKAFDEAWNEVAAVISAIVSINHALGLFARLAAVL